ncbi:hypothetical protein DFJ58DRAFT_744731 [Suillus subalutaceus]|uniref:uncharacterized protein n=1 Tax=Suillus subalutaceus TaxID=48586 RepID=UPI001B86168A|nr:uncharacterized protein DFJ58DRAFT_744731 [Suillus subalutaceus]KAG1858953.1 hypothetical protein DFJ58DRAFT_744731 [Suillus subalutaceus]
MSSATQDLIPQLYLGNTFGALFIGVVFAAILFGLSNIQAFFYFQTHRDTGMSFPKLTVAWLWILDALHLFLIVHCVYYYLVAHYADMSALTEIVWSFKLQIVIVVIIVYGVHLLYFHRIWIVGTGRSRVLPIAVGVIVTLGSGVAIALIWAIYQCHVFSDLTNIEWATFLALGTITFVDFIIASSLCYLLATSRTGFSSTDSMITKLMAYIINTGCLTSMCSLTVMITCAVMPHNFIFLGVDFLVAGLYVNSFFALLNARHYFQPATETNHFSEVHMRHDIYHPELNVMASQEEELQGSWKNIFKHLGRSAMPHRPIEVTVETNSFSSV